MKVDARYSMVSSAFMDTSNWYFAYGAGAPPGFDFSEVQPDLNKVSGALAFLPDHEAFFMEPPDGIHGSQLALRPRKGQVVSGLLLDKPANVVVGHPLTSSMVLTGNGDVVRAQLHMSMPGAQSQERAPHADYLSALRACRGKLNLECMSLNAAALGERSADVFPGLFVYGTLMRGECRFHILTTECSIQRVEPGSAEGRLLDLGAYPGLVEASESGSRVRGELCTLPNSEHAFSVLDCVEDFLGWESLDSTYQRVLIRVRLDDGSCQVAWTYRLVSIPFDSQEIEGGDWRRRGDGLRP